MPGKNHFSSRLNNRNQQPVEPGPGPGSRSGNPNASQNSGLASSSTNSFDSGAPLPPLQHEASGQGAGQLPSPPPQLPGAPPQRRSLQRPGRPPPQGQYQQLSPQSPQQLHRLPPQLMQQ